MSKDLKIVGKSKVDLKDNPYNVWYEIGSPGVYLMKINPRDIYVNTSTCTVTYTTTGSYTSW